MFFTQVNKQEFLCHGRMLDDGYNNHVHVNIDGKNEKFSFVPSADSIHVFTKVRWILLYFTLIMITSLFDRVYLVGAYLRGTQEVVFPSVILGWSFSRV